MSPPDTKPQGPSEPSEPGAPSLLDELRRSVLRVPNVDTPRNRVRVRGREHRAHRLPIQRGAERHARRLLAARIRSVKERQEAP